MDGLRSWLGRLLPWAVFLAIVALMRDLWALVFMAFVLGSIMNKANAALVARSTWSRRQILVLSYLLLLLVLNLLLWAIVPRAYKEAKLVLADLRPKIQERYTGAQMWIKNSWLADLLPEDALESVRADSLKFVQEHFSLDPLVRTARMFGKGAELLLFAFLAFIVSALVLWDQEALGRGIGRLADGPIGPWYRALAPPVLEFFGVVAEVFDAQVVIAAVNTTLTWIGMFVLHIPFAHFLSVLVFACGLIPVLGAFISSVPIVLVALTHGGLWLAVQAVLMILGVHALETYVLNPRIMGGHLRMHPVLVLLTLLVGEHYFGVWGVILGIPAVTYAARKLVAGPVPPVMEPIPQGPR